MRTSHWHAVTAMWSLVHSYAHLAIAGKFERLGDDDRLDAFVQQSLAPILDAVLTGLIDPLPRRAPMGKTSRPAKAAAASRPTRGARR